MKSNSVSQDTGEFVLSASGDEVAFIILGNIAACSNDVFKL